MIDRRIVLCAAASLVGHLAGGEALSNLPERTTTPRPRRVEVRVVAPPVPPPPEPPPPEPPPPEPPRVEPPKVVEPRPPPRVRPSRPAPATDTPPPPTTAVPTTAGPASDAPAQPVFGVSMESTTSGGSGPAVPIGNTGSPGTPRDATPTPSPGRAGPPVAAAHEVTRMPMPRGSCTGTYTDEARAAGIEGVVVLDLVVDEQGRARDIRVVTGLPHGLTEAAVAALRACRFDPGERSGAAVPVRVRGFKIRFVLE